MVRLLPVSLVVGLFLLSGCLEPSGPGTCEGFEAPALERYDIGEVGVDQTRAVAVEVVNLCSGRVTITATVDAAGFSVDPPSLALGSDDAQSFSVAWTAVAEGSVSATLTLTGDDGQVETVTVTAEGIPWLDEDDDGYSAVSIGGDDCDDTDPGVNPGAEEIWYDGLDQDCSGGSDFDQDGDGVAVPEDCDDTDAEVLPGIEDLADGKDSDCDGLIDEGALGVDDLLITEVMHSPLAVGDDVGEWIELHNRGGAALDLRGYKVADGEGAGGFVIDKPLSVPAGGYVVLGADGRGSTNGGVSVDFVYDRDTLKLLDTAFGITLLGEADRVVSRVSWGEGWPAVEGTSLQIDPSADAQGDLGTRGLWCEGTARMPGGDKGTPGAGNTACPRWDLDLDGISVQDGDCDDDDPNAYPGNSEVFGDGIDNDCSGLADEARVADIDVARFTGQVSPTVDALGFPDDLSVGDINGDGQLDLLLGARFGRGYAGGVYLIDGRDALSKSGTAQQHSYSVFEGASATNQLGGLAPFAGDYNGDGIDDLAIGGTDARASSDVAAAVLLGGAGLGGRLGPSAATVTLTGSVATTGGDVHGGLDLDGDGRAELIHGDVGHNSFAGRITVVSGGTTGTIAVGDAARRWTGVAGYDQAGAALGGGDVDGDGYDDLLVTSFADDAVSRNGGAVYLILGGTSLPADGALDKVADARLVGATSGTRLGEGAAPRLGDFDGDGNLDVLAGAPIVDQAFVWYDVGALTGTTSTLDAEHALSGPGTPDSFGVGLAAADIDGDGIHEVVIGAADDQTATTSLATVPGQVYVFRVAGAGRSLGPGDASYVLSGSTKGDAIGQSVLGADLDGDGIDEIIIGGVGDAGGAGSVSVVGL